VVPGYSVDADAGSGGKMDYAILRDGDPILLIECREVGTLLGREHRSRLTRYFMLPRYFRVAREARFAILTNGMVYQFFTALDEQHRMDLEPFLSVDMARLDEGQIRELARFRREVFDADEIFAGVRELRLRREIGARVAADLREPPEALVRPFARGM